MGKRGCKDRLRFALVNVTGDLFCIGARKLVSFLDKKGFHSEIIFVPNKKAYSGLGLRGTNTVSGEDFKALAR